MTQHTLDMRPGTEALTNPVDPWMQRLSRFGATLFFLALIAFNFVDVDLWHQMALVRESLAVGHLLRTDLFAYTPTIQPWVDHEWGAGVVAFFATKWFGGRAIVVLKFSLALATGLLCARASEKNGAEVRFVMLCAPLAIFLSQLGFLAAVRAQVYSFFLVALLLWCLQVDRRGGRRWIFPWLLLFPLWVNLHAGFVVGMGVLALHLVEEIYGGGEVKRLFFVMAVMAGEMFLTPYGTDYVRYLQRALWMARPFAPEWRPVWDLGPWWVFCFAAAIGIGAYAVAATGIRKTPGLLVLAATTIEAMMHRKLLPFFALAWLCYVPSALQQTRAGVWLSRFMIRRRPFVVAAWSVLASASLVAAIRQKPWDVFVPQPIYPVGPVEYLAEQKFSGNLMVPFRLGAYVTWKLFPDVKVALDGRYEETYPNEVVERIFRFYEARPAWQTALTTYATDAVLIPRDAPISEQMAETNWQRTYRDRDFDIYVRPGLGLPSQDWTGKSFRGTFP